jgi:uncharacterized protein YjbJ (UPF0337 family)
VGQRTDCGRRHDYPELTLRLIEFMARFGRRCQPSYGEIIMNKNQVKGQKDKVKGKAKEVTGKVTGNKAMEHKGKVEKHGGKAQAAYGDLKHDIKGSKK